MSSKLNLNGLDFNLNFIRINRNSLSSLVVASVEQSLFTHCYYNICENPKGSSVNKSNSMRLRRFDAFYLLLLIVSLYQISDMPFYVDPFLTLLLYGS